MRFLIRWLINAVALYAAIYLLRGVIQPQSSSWLSLIWLALIFGLVNALVRPLISLLTCPLIVLTLGLFVLVINTVLFALTGWIGSQFGVGFTIAQPYWWNAFLGSLIVSVVSIVLSLVLIDDRERRHRVNR